MHMQKKVERLLHPKLQENLWKHKLKQYYVLRKKKSREKWKYQMYIGASNIFFFDK